MGSVKGAVETGEQLREWRRGVPCTQERLGQELGVSSRCLRSWESGDQPLPRTVQLALRGLEEPLRRRIAAERRKAITKKRRELEKLERGAPLAALRACDALAKQLRLRERPDEELLRQLRDAREVMENAQ